MRDLILVKRAFCLKNSNSLPFFLTCFILLFGGLSISTQAQSCVNPPTGMVGWWPMDGNSDDLINGLNGVVSGSGGQFGPGMVLDGFKSNGQGNLIEIGDTPLLDVSNLTLDAWIKIDVLNYLNMPIIGKGNATGLDIRTPYAIGVMGKVSPTQGKVFFLISDGSSTDILFSNTILPIGSFVHIAVTADGSSLNLYINGVLDNTSAQTIIPHDGANPVQIGSIKNAIYNNYFNGIIDEVAIFSRALTPLEITDIYNAGSAGKCKTSGCTNFPAQLAPQNCASCNQIRFDFCKGDATPDLEALLTSNTSYDQSGSFLWYEDNNGVQGNPAGKPTVNTNLQGKKFYWVSQVDNLCEGDARRVRVRVRKNSIVELVLPAIGCNGGQIDLASGVSDLKNIASAFTFYDSDPDLGNPSPIGSVTATQGQVNNGQYAVVNLPSNPITYYATASNHTGCQVTGSDEVISGGGALLAPVGNVTVNSGQMVSIQFAPTNATHVLWFNGSTNPQIGMMAYVGLGDILFTAINNTANPLVANLFAIPYQGNCAGAPQYFTITVLPNANSRQTKNSLELQALTLNAHDVQLTWEIHYEFPLTHFEVEKQTTNGSWEKIADATYAATQSEYSYLDRNGLGEDIKYRLKLIHADGRAIWSDEVLVGSDYNLTPNDANRFTIYPNPNAGHFSLKAHIPIEGEWSYSIIDNLGRTIQTGKLNSHENVLDISKQPAGIYFLELAGPVGERVVKRVLRE